MHLHDYIIISQNNTTKTLPHLTVNTTSSKKKLTPQADQELGQYRSGYDWYSKLIRFEHEHWLLKF